MNSDEPLLRAAIARISASLALGGRIPPRSLTERVAAKFPDIEGAAPMPSKKNFDAIARELLTRCLDGESIESHELRDAAWCLWDTNPALASTPALSVIVDALHRSADRRAYRSFASAFLSKFDPKLHGITEVAEVLTRRASNVAGPWERLQDVFDFFHPQHGPSRVADAALAARTSPADLLVNNGLGALDANSGYAKACEGAILRGIEDDSSLDPLARLDLVRKISLKNDKQLYFQDHAPLVANALILPFGISMPDRYAQEAYLPLLIGLFGDPRLHPGRWSRMREAEQSLKRWLARASLVQFLDVVDRVAKEHMWVFRRAFWEAVYRRELIEDAWVVFDRSGAAIAKQAFGDQLPFASLKGAQDGQAVLLLRLRRGLVAEWSHDGRCVIWNNDEDRSAPRMYKKAYDAHELRHPTATDRVDGQVFAVSHNGSGTYSWQRKVADKIFRITGVKISQNEYEVR